MKLKIVLNKSVTAIIEVEKLEYLEVIDAVYDQTESYILAGVAWGSVEDGDYVVVG